MKIMALPDPGRPVNDYESTQVCTGASVCCTVYLLSASFLLNSY